MKKQSHTFHVHGMHCQSCALHIEDRLMEVQGIESVQVSLRDHLVAFQGEFDHSVDELLGELTALVSEKGYAFSTQPEKKQVNWKEFVYAVPTAILVISLFVLLQKAGLVNLINAGEVSYATALIVGLVASVSTCLAVVGGLVLSLSASYAQKGGGLKPQVTFHVGRLLGFFILGGFLGVIGKSFHLNLTISLVLGMAVSFVMLVLGVNLLDVFHRTNRWQISLPKVLGRHIMDKANAVHFFTPFFIGAATFFLPCGFTQSMQFYTLTTGSFVEGGMLMFAFALGTLPVLGLLSFSSFSIVGKDWSGIFFKSAGMIVIVLALFTFINTLVGAGYIDPVFNL